MKNDFDRLLGIVMREARAAAVPVSEHIQPRVEINSRAKSRFGLCRQNPDGSFTIQLSSILLEAPEQACRQTLAHELIHTCKGCMNHGSLFKQYAAVMNRLYGYHIKRTNNPAEMGIEAPSASAKKLTLVCDRCGRHLSGKPEVLYAAKRAAPRCSCGGYFQPTTVNEMSRYLLQCQQCGKQFPRSKMSRVVSHPNSYRCKCGGSLRRIR